MDWIGCRRGVDHNAAWCASTHDWPLSRRFQVCRRFAVGGGARRRERVIDDIGTDPGCERRNRTIEYAFAWAAVPCSVAP
jgi:hypothetical protein